MYRFDSLIIEQAKKGVAIFLATPMMYGDAECKTLVTCGCRVVIKAAPQPSLQALSACDDALVEIAAMQYLQSKTVGGRHDNIISLLDVVQDDEYLFIVLPYLPGGDLFTKIQKLEGQGGLSEEEAFCFMRQVIRGLLHMKNEARLAHHDLSLENICFDDEGRAKLIDLGMCLKVPTLSSCGSNDCSPLDRSSSNLDAFNSSNPPAILLASQPCQGKPS